MSGWASPKALATASEPLTKDQKTTSPLALLPSAGALPAVLEAQAERPSAIAMSAAAGVAPLRHVVMSCSVRR